MGLLGPHLTLCISIASIVREELINYLPGANGKGEGTVITDHRPFEITVLQENEWGHLAEGWKGAEEGLTSASELLLIRDVCNCLPLTQSREGCLGKQGANGSWEKQDETSHCCDSRAGRMGMGWCDPWGRGVARGGAEHSKQRAFRHWDMRDSC